MYREHVQTLQSGAERALAATGFDVLVLSSGRAMRYFADDQDAPFHPTPHFARWTPVDGPHHLLLVRPGQRPLLVRVAPEDYWYEQAPLGSPFWSSEFELREVASEGEAWNAVASTVGLEGAAFIGDDPAVAAARGVPEAGLVPTELVLHLDWDRGTKTAYEIECLDEAAKLGARGHIAARRAFEQGASELEIHHAYVQAVGCTDADLPYSSIVGLDEKGAILHYTGKRTGKGPGGGGRDGKVLLIDSGATYRGYCSDITRTWTRNGCDPTFRELVIGLDGLQQELCAMVRPGLPYGDLHHSAHGMIGDLLHALGVLRVGGDEAVAAGVTAPFFPHGLGHFLGLQVHDVGGHQKAPSGGRVPPPEAHPYLRTTREIEAGQVFTIEPGIYFIEMLLREHRKGGTAQLFDWPLVDRLTPCGGARIEDNVVVTADGHRNLSRPYLAHESVS
jgi:Xaa-Pro dipeptidase